MKRVASAVDFETLMMVIMILVERQLKRKKEVAKKRIERVE